MIQTGNERTLPTCVTLASPVQMADSCYAILRAQLNSPPRQGLIFSPRAVRQSSLYQATASKNQERK